MKQVIRKQYTNEELIEIVRKADENAKSLGIALSVRVFNEYCQLNYGSMLIGVIRKQFASPGHTRDGWTEVLKRFGYQPKEPYSRERIIDIIYEIYQESGRQPTEDMIAKKGLSLSTVYRYFGRTSNAVMAMYESKGIQQEYRMPANVSAIRKLDRAGESLRHLPIGLEESPVNEQGVVLLFGKIHFAIGFPSIIKAQQDFPDCLAYSTIGGQRHRARIEFKFRSASYYRSKKSIEEWNRNVDYLICWEHNTKSLNRKFKTKIIALKEELDKSEVLNMISTHYNGKLKGVE